VSIYAARVLDAWAPSTMTRAIRIERPPEITFVASQATRLILGGDLARPMTIASGPARPYLDFAVQRTASEFKRARMGRSTRCDCEPWLPRSQGPSGTSRARWRT